VLAAIKKNDNRFCYMRRLTITLIVLFTFGCSNQTEKKQVKKNHEENNTVQLEKEIVEKSSITKKDSSIDNVNHDFTYQPQTNNKVNDLVKEFNGLNNFYKQFEKPSQKFKINISKDTIIICKEGTKITFNQNSFITESGQLVKGEILFEVKEYYQISDMLLANLSTKSNQEILETGGMLFIEAFSKGEKCRLKKDEVIEISFPTKNEKKNMKLFYGDWESKKINWTLSEPIPIVLEETEEAEVFSIVEAMPEFPGGQQKLIEYLTSNVTYPKSARDSGIGGTIYVGFIIDEFGHIQNARIIRGIIPSLDQAAISAVEKMPRWKPGEQRGKKVKVQMTVPLRFSIGGEGFNTNNEKYAEDFEKDVSDENISKTEMSEISQYIFSISKLGWINCDRFYKTDDPKVDYIVNLENTNDIDIKIIFNKINSILTGSRKHTKYLFDSIPVGYNVTLVAIKYENDQYYLAVKKTTISKKEEPILVFKPVTMALLKEEMKKLNRL
jgi:TonB family protein